MTPLKAVYDSFFTLITDDMYMEITPEETERDCYSILLMSLPLFEFPIAPIYIEEVEIDYRPEKVFNRDLTQEEINILACGMVEIWLQRQITTCDLIRQRASGVDFKFSSQGNHLAKLLTLSEDTKNEHKRLQRLYSRRTISDIDGTYKSTFGSLAIPPAPRGTRYSRTSP